MIKKDWFKIKGYPHIGEPLTHADRPWVEKLVKDKKRVSQHSFSPFIFNPITVRKFRKEKFQDGSRSELRVSGDKTRPIYYANHIDACIYGYYSSLIQESYESYLSDAGIKECVTAYRKIPKDPDNLKAGNKCNIDFASEVFQYIKNSGKQELIAIAFDICSFFDNLSHKKLKVAWREVIKSGTDLPCDHYNVFRNITKFSYVYEREIFNEFKSSIIVKDAANNIKRKKVNKRKYLKENKAVAFCQSKEIDILREKNYIKSNKYEKDKKDRYITDENGNKVLRKKGIPQGSPISAVLANIYLYEFDKAVSDFISGIGGLYRRYSDDIVVVCEPAYEQQIISFVEKLIKEVELEVNCNKTQIFHFIKKGGRYMCYEKNACTKKLLTNTMFDYLGFSFDGHYTYLKSASLASFYRKMKRSVRRGKYYSSRINNSTNGELFKSRLYKRFTFLGAKRRKIYKRVPGTTNKWQKTKKDDWGNYLRYAIKAANNIPDNKIKSQIRRHWKVFHGLINASL
ncbi:reverse transcriptase domain-containing protein [Cytophagaceae bacterium ABcell3]|nr:reverse transcriptase domain-containing protein [Cytophagaceae bacterium ABcell3]